MNCEDISRIVDAGSFHMLTSAEREAAHAHARGCTRCAATWAAHEQLARISIPPMPAELEARVRTLVMSAASRHHPGLRRWTVVGALAALAAAAAIGVIYLMDQPGPSPALVTVVQPEDGVPPIAVVPPPVATRAARSEPRVSPTLHVASTHPEAPLLLPPPDDSARERIIDQTLQKVAEVHPELVQGPEMQGSFYVGALISRDGSLVDSIVREVPPPSATPEGARAERAVSREIDERISQQARSSISYIPRAQRFLLPNKQALRADTWVNLGIAFSNFQPSQPSRSPAIIVATVRGKHPDLSGMLASATSGETAMLTVLVADDGSIEREVLTRKPRPTPPDARMTEEELKRVIADLRVNANAAGDASKLMGESIAAALSVGVDEIGQIGMATITEGDRYLASDGTGNMRSVDNSGSLAITYAFRRRPGETGPYIAKSPLALAQSSGEMDEPSIIGPQVDKSLAAILLKREIPDAFTSDYRQAGTPVLVLNHLGEVLRSGRVRAPNGGQPDYGVLIQQMVPGLKIGAGMYGVTLHDANGNSTEAALAWEAAPNAK